MSFMSACEEQPLSAYHDGELDAASVARVEAHLRQCPACAAELAGLREASGRLRAYAFDDLTPTELGKLHRAVDKAAAAESEADDDRRIWRIGGTMGLIAASVLVVGLAWLKAIPTMQPAPPAQVATLPAAAWERMAMTLRPGPLDALPRESDPQAVQLALADWHVEGLAPLSP